VQLTPRIVVQFKLVVGLLLAVLSAEPATAITQQAALPYGYCFKEASRKYAIPVVLLQAVVATESNWNPRARSHANAHGLMQIQWPGTARHLGVRRVSQLYKPCTNIKLGTRYLRELLDRYSNDERRALAAYNYGPGRIGNTGNIPAGAERYVAKVRQHRARLLGVPVPQPSVVHPVAVATQSGVAKVEQGSRIATFSSRLRANRFARLLRKRVPRGSFTVLKPSTGGYELWLTDGVKRLNANDRVLLTSLGWRL